MTCEEHSGAESAAALQLEVENRVLHALSGSRQALMRAADEIELLQDICRIVVEECGYAMVWIGYAEDDAAKTVRPVASSGFEEGYLEGLEISWAETEQGIGPTGTAIRTGQPCICRNILTDPRFGPWRNEAVERGFASSIAVPLVGGQQVLGALNIYSKEPDPFSENEVKLLAELARDLSQGIVTIRLRVSHAEAEAAGRRTEDDYRRLFEDDLTGDFIAAPDGRILLCNPAFVRLFRFSDRQQALQTNMARLFPPGDSWDEFVGFVRRRKVLNRNESERRTFDGSPIHVVENVVGVFNEQGELIRLKGYVFDDTERKQAMLALQRANRQLQEQAEELSTMNEELQSQTDELSETNEELRTQAEELQEANEDLQASEVRMEEALEQVELEKRRLEAVMEVLPVGVAPLDSQGGITASNIAFEDIWGGPHPPTRSVGDYQSYQAWWPETGEPVQPDDWASSKALHSGGVVTGQLLKIRRFDGLVAYVINGAAAIRDGKGRVTGSAVAIQNVTDLHRMQEDLQKLTERLERRVAERTETLERTIEQLEDEVRRRVEVEAQLQDRSRLLEGFFRHTIAPLAFMDREFNLIRVNEAFARMFGREPEDFISRNYFSFDLDSEHRAIFQMVVDRKQTFHAFARPFFGLRRNEHPTYWNAQLTPVLDEGHEVQFLVFNLEDVTERQRAFAELEERARQLQRLTMELSHVEDRERKRLARILHDDLQQLLVGARLHVDYMEKKLNHDAGEVGEAIERTRGLLVEAVEKSRSLSHELSPPYINHGKLGEALDWLAKQMHVTCGLSITLEAEDDADCRSEGLRSFIYKATQEMLFNVVKHARVHEATVRLRRHSGFIRLVVADGGVGFDAGRLEQIDGFGLFSIQERAALLGGSMRFKSVLGKGSVFVLSVPAEDASGAQSSR